MQKIFAFMVAVFLSAPSGAEECALCLPAGKGNAAEIRRLLDGGANPNAANEHNITPLMIAAHDRHAAAVSLLLDGGADANLAGVDGWTPLMMAVSHGGAEEAKVLLAAGAAANRKNEKGETALIIAASSGEADIVKLLLGNGADIGAADNEGHNALAHALRPKFIHGEPAEDAHAAAHARGEGHDAAAKILQNYAPGDYDDLSVHKDGTETETN